MANGIHPAQRDDTVVQFYAHIDDFSAGCYDNTNVSDTSPVVSAPLGAAQVQGTWCCMALPGGGLGALPGISYTGTYLPGFPGALTTWYIVGVALNPGLNMNAPELIMILEGDDGTTHYVLAFSVLPGTAENAILSSNSATTPGIFGSPYPAWTRMSPTGAAPWPPELVFPTAVATDANGNLGHLYIYPPPDTPTDFAVQDLIISGDSPETGQIIAYSNRILVLAGIDYAWPAGGGINTNENVYYTEPPLSIGYGLQPNQPAVLSAETPWGYGAWGSVSIGELLLVKKHGGAVALYGDIDDPSSVILLPGVEPTGGFVGSAAATPIGLIYCAENRGAWLWNGGNVSQKISPQLRDDFYDAATPANIPSNNYGFFVGQWQDWIIFSNNYLYNAAMNSWWVLYPQSGQGSVEVPGQTFFWFEGGNLGNQLWAAPLSITNATGEKNWIVTFDSTVPSNSYQWTSVPIHVMADATRLVDVRQIIIRVSQPDGGTLSSVTVTCGGESHTTNGPIGTEPTVFRFNWGAEALGETDIVVQVAAFSNELNMSAPILHSIDIGYNPRSAAREHLMANKNLLIPNKAMNPVSQPGYRQDMYTIEQFMAALQVGGGGSDFFNILDFGGVGDGSTDNSPAIAAAMAAACAAGGGIIYFPPGIYEARPFTVTCDYITFFISPGASLACSILVGAGSAFITVQGTFDSFISVGQGRGGNISGGFSTGDPLHSMNIWFQVGADNGVVAGLTLTNSGDAVRSNANNTRVTGNYLQQWYFNGIWYVTDGEPINGGWQTDNVIEMPSVNVVPSTPPNIGSLSACNVQNNNFHNAQATASSTSPTVSITGYTLTGAEVGAEIEIVGGGPYGAGSSFFQNLYTTITAVDVALQTVTLNVPLLSGTFTDNFCRIIGTIISGVVVRDNIINYTGYAAGISVQLSVCNFCMVDNNVATALSGAIPSGYPGSSFGVSIAGGRGHTITNNKLNMNGNAACIELDSSQTVVANNVVTQIGKGQPIHNTSTTGLCQDQIIANNVITVGYGPNTNPTNACIEFNSPYAVGIKIIGNELHLDQYLATPNQAGVIRMGCTGYLIQGNDFDCGGCYGVIIEAGGAQAGRILDNFFYNGCLSIAHYNPTAQGPISDLLIKNNQSSADCVNFTSYTVTTDPTVPTTISVPSGQNLDSTLAQGVADYIYNGGGAPRPFPNVLALDNLQSGFGKRPPTRIAFASTPKTLTNVSAQRWIVYVQGDASAGPTPFTGFGLNGYDFTVTGSSDSTIGWNLSGSGSHLGAGPFAFQMDPGDTLDLSWTGTNNPIVLILALL